VGFGGLGTGEEKVPFIQVKNLAEFKQNRNTAEWHGAGKARLPEGASVCSQEMCQHWFQSQFGPQIYNLTLDLTFPLSPNYQNT
jgi:hypothetical protein